MKTAAGRGETQTAEPTKARKVQGTAAAVKGGAGGTGSRKETRPDNWNREAYAVQRKGPVLPDSAEAEDPNSIALPDPAPSRIDAPVVSVPAVGGQVFLPWSTK